MKKPICQIHFYKNGKKIGTFPLKELSTDADRNAIACKNKIKWDFYLIDNRIKVTSRGVVSPIKSKK